MIITTVGVTKKSYGIYCEKKCIEGFCFTRLYLMIIQTSIYAKNLN